MITPLLTFVQKETTRVTLTGGSPQNPWREHFEVNGDLSPTNPIYLRFVARDEATIFRHDQGGSEITD